jgi:hypothetical protein
MSWWERWVGVAMMGLSDGWGNVSPFWPAIVRFPRLSGASFLRTGQGARISTSARFMFIAIATNQKQDLVSPRADSLARAGSKRDRGQQRLERRPVERFLDPIQKSADFPHPLTIASTKEG